MQGMNYLEIVRQMILENMIVLFSGFILDSIWGDPHFLWHPVQGIGYLITKLEKLLWKIFRLQDEREKTIRRKQIAGGLLVFLVLLFSVLVPAILLCFAYWLNPMVSTILKIIFCYQILAMRSLNDESMKVYKAIKKDGLAEGRKAVSMIVGRDTEKLDEEGVVKAAVETIAENTSDGVIAPLFYLFLLGPIGGFGYKAINTMDSMVAYKNDRYRYFGTAAAKMDDFLNYIPARISALLMLVATRLLSLKNRIYNPANAWKIYWRDRYNHASPNSAQTEAVCAGALQVQLAGNAYYFGKLYEKPTIGDPVRKIELEDIRRANHLMIFTSILMLVIVELIMFFILFILKV